MALPDYLDPYSKQVQPPAIPAVTKERIQGGTMSPVVALREALREPEGAPAWATPTPSALPVAAPAPTAIAPRQRQTADTAIPTVQNVAQPSGAGEYERMQAIGAAEKRAGVGTPTLHAYDPNDFIDRGKLHTPAPAAIQEAPRAEAVPNLGDMTWGQLATWSAQQRLKGKERGYAAQQEMEGKRQAGAERIEGMREKGALGRTEREAALRREATGEERAYKAPEQAAAIKAHEAQAGLYGAQSEAAQLSMREAKELQVLKSKVGDTSLPLETRKAYQAEIDAIERKKLDQQLELMREKVKAEREFANGGLIEGYADGGAIGRSQTGELNPLVAQYGQYISEAARAGVSPVPFAKYLNLMSSTRGAMSGTPTQFADGGDVSALNRPLEGPGTGRSDSIPAVIDGGQPAALSKGEFVIPEHVVRKKGTEFFEKLIAQYAEEAQANG